MNSGLTVPGVSSTLLLLPGIHYIYTEMNHVPLTNVQHMNGYMLLVNVAFGTSPHDSSGAQTGDGKY